MYHLHGTCLLDVFFEDVKSIIYVFLKHEIDKSSIIGSN